MLTKRQVQEVRRDEIDNWKGGRIFEVIVFDTFAQGTNYTFLDDVFDADGDAIKVSAEYVVEKYCGMIQAILPHGTPRAHAARVLRKFADMLEGPRGDELSMLSRNSNSPDEARFDDTGVLHIYNCRKQREEYEQFLREEEETERNLGNESEVEK